MAEIKYFTQEGLQRIKDELDELINKERPRIAQMIAEARDKGDLSENAEYDAAKEAQGLLELKISQLQDLLVSARVLDESKMDITKGAAALQSKDQESEKQRYYELYISTGKEADLKNGKISVNSPIAKGLLGKSVGEKAEIEVPAGIITFEILEVSR